MTMVMSAARAEWISFATPDLMGQEVYEVFVWRTGLPFRPDGWGFLHCVDEHGGRLTLATDDLEMLVSIQDEGLCLLGEERFALCRAGWPEEWVRG